MDYIKQYELLYKIKKNYGKTSIKLYDMLKKIINDLNISSVLDYGCGKSKLLDLIKKNSKIKIFKYDPAIKKYSTLTKNKTDLVICTDVLQHVPLYDLDRVLKEIKSKGIYILFPLYKLFILFIYCFILNVLIIKQNFQMELMLIVLFMIKNGG